jgi:tetratricopeptide (TPR) repeat protein
MGDAEKAKEYYTKAAGQRGGGGFMTESRFYRAMALKKLDRASEAHGIFEDLIKTGTDRLAREETADFFAKFGERESPQARQASAHYLIGLGCLGKGDASNARTEFATAAKLNVSHVWARQFLNDN